MVSISESLASVTPPNVVTTEVPSPAGIVVVPEETALELMEGVAKGGYPVDISAQSTLDLTSVGQSELECASTLIESGLDPAAVGQLELEVSYTVLNAQDTYSEQQDFPPSITDVIQPMEMAELVDILPTLSLIEEEIPSGPSTPSMMDMLESFGLGIGENNTFFDLQNSDLNDEAGSLSEPNLHCNNSSSVKDTHCEKEEESHGEATSASHTLSDTGGDVPRLSWDFPPDATETQQESSKGKSFPVRNQVEWDRPSNSSS